MNFLHQGLVLIFTLKKTDFARPNFDAAALSLIFRPHITREKRILPDVVRCIYNMLRAIR